MSHSIETLGAEMKARLGELEEDIEVGLNAYAVVGSRLRQVRDEHLYRLGGHESFDAFCRSRLRLSPGRARQLIGESEVLDILSSA